MIHINMLFKLETSSKAYQMKILKRSIFFLLICLFITCTKSNHDNSEMSDSCSVQVCNNNEPNSRYVQFPFLISNRTLPSFCGYPGFDLLCNEDDKLLINLPNLGAFTVEDIDYVKQELWLNDPDDCLPRKLLSLNGSSFVGKSQFFPPLEKDYWFFNCSSAFLNDSSDHIDIKPITCLSGTSYEVFATLSKEIIAGNSSSMCDRIGPIKVPIGPYDEDSSSIIRGDIRLSWSQPRECGKCYEHNGGCRFKSNGNLDVECFNLPQHGLARKAIVAIALAFAAPLALVTFIVIYFVFKTIDNNRQGHGAHDVANTTQGATSQPQGRVVQGLDRAIVESYPKVVLGESLRLPKADDMHCPICLGEYLPKDSLRTIPDCGHCFHADCIDEWLCLNASCPVCRNYPSINKALEIDA